MLRLSFLVVLSLNLTSVIDDAYVHLGWQDVGGEAALLNSDRRHKAIEISSWHVRALGGNLLVI